MRFFREKAGVASRGTAWVCIDDDGWLYVHHTLLGLLWQLLTEWRHDRHMVG